MNIKLIAKNIIRTAKTQEIVQEIMSYIYCHTLADTKPHPSKIQLLELKHTLESK